MQLAGVAATGDSAMTLGDDVGRPAGPTEIAQWVEQVGASEHIASPAKLTLLGHLHHRTVPGLEPLAEPLVSPTGRRGVQAIDHLLSSIEATLAERAVSNHAGDPLGRTPNELFTDRPTCTDHNRARLFDSLMPAITQTMLSVRPMCDAVEAEHLGKRVQYVETEYFSKQPLHHFETMVDPRSWPKCELMSLCFKSMKKVKGQKKRHLEGPDSGWERVLRETVDLSAFGIPDPVRTDLRIRFVRGQDFIGSTFEMDRDGSVDGQLTHDQGYLLVEDLDDVPVVQARRFTTMKSFRFAKAIENLPVDVICPFWSLAESLLIHACMGLAHEEPAL